jgi:nucleoside-diphosphate-sugar epimerase
MATKACASRVVIPVRPPNQMPTTAIRARSELGLELTPLEDGLRETYRWYQQQKRPQPDFAWEDRLLVSAQ